MPQNESKQAKTSKNKIQNDTERVKTSQNEPKRRNTTQNKIQSDPKWSKIIQADPKSKQAKITHNLTKNEPNQNNPKGAKTSKKKFQK